jgi:hypothetical protein
VSTVKAAFLPDLITLPLDRVLPSRKLKPGVKATTRYEMIKASVREVGIVEPLIVYPQKGGVHLLLDGHVRLEVLRDLETTEVTCLVSTDDENCTYNHRVSRIAPIQENRMILKAIEAGVPEERIAKALNVSPKTIRESKTRFTDICAEALEILKAKPIADMAVRVFKKVKPYRQVEMAELMSLSNTYTAPYARALLAVTPADQLVEPSKATSKTERVARLEQESRGLERDFLVLEESYSRDTLNLQLAHGYLKTLLQNTKVARHLARKHAELLAQLQEVVAVTTLEG